MSMIVSYVFLAAESESGISFSPTRLNFAAHGVSIFRNYRKSKNLYKNSKFPYLCTPKSRRVGEKWLSNSDSAAEKTQKMIILINCVFQKKFCYTVLSLC